MTSDPPPLQRAWALLLGGGQGKRAGGPKALKLVDGRPWWRLQVQAMARDGLTAVAVLHPDAWQSSEPLDPEASSEDSAHPALCLTVRSDPAEPAFGSLLRGLEALPPAVATWVLPVDCPWPGAAALRPLTQAIEGNRFWAVLPEAQDGDGSWRGGHPVWLSERAVAELRTLAGTARSDGRLDEWLRRRGSEVARVQVADAAVLANHNLDGFSR